MLGFAVGVLALLLGSGRRAWAGLGLAALVVGYAIPGVLPARVSDRFEAIYREGPRSEAVHDEVADPSSLDRLRIWGSAITAIAHNPLGFGLSQFKSVTSAFGNVRGKDAHNYFLLVGVELGVVGLILVVGLLGLVLSDAWTLSRHGEDAMTRAIGLGVLGMVGAVIMVNLVGSRLMQPQPSIYFWVLAGMTVRLRDAMTLPPRERAVPATPPAPAAWPRR
jgi:O-antigen ligase